MNGDVGSKPIYDYKIERHVKIPMRDGINLSANIFLPNVSSG
jgi:predicted acyl esterase